MPEMKIIDMSKVNLKEVDKFEKIIEPMFHRVYDKIVGLLEKNKGKEEEISIAINNKMMIFLLCLFKETAKDTLLIWISKIMKLQADGVLDKADEKVEQLRYIG